MLTTDTLHFGEMTPDEIRGLRNVARKSWGLDRLGPMLARVQYFAAFLGCSLDAEAVKGLARMEIELLLRIASRRAENVAELRMKAMLVRCRVSSDDHVALMVAAAIEADGQRLGVSPKHVTDRSRGREN